MGNNYTGESFQHDRDLIYDHLLVQRRVETPQALIERFRQLLVSGNTYPDPVVAAARDRIVTCDSFWACQEFFNTLNRCCYILINHWWSQSEFRLELKQATVDLVDLFQNPVPIADNTLTSRQLRELIQQFTKTPEYSLLQKRARVAGCQASVTRQQANSQQTYIRDFIHRYPLLYRHYLHHDQASEDGMGLGLKAIQQVQAQQKVKTEHNLLWYATNLMLKQSRQSHRSLENPTLLNDRQFLKSIWQFAGKSQGHCTYREAAVEFRKNMRQAKTFHALKRSVGNHLKMAILHSPSPHYGQHNFNHWLDIQLHNTFPHYDLVQPTGVILVKTCGNLLDVLVNPKRPHNHAMFLDMVANLGAPFTIGFLLKLILLCGGVRMNLEAVKAHVLKQFTLIFNHYETRSPQEIGWLIEIMENLHIAFTIHFGTQGFHRWSSLVTPQHARENGYSLPLPDRPVALLT